VNLFPRDTTTLVIHIITALWKERIIERIDKR
jgi:hypothetical protein